MNNKRKRDDEQSGVAGPQRGSDQWAPFGFPFHLLFKMGSPRAILNLAACSSEMMTNLAPMISTGYLFKFVKRLPFEFRWYQPKKLIYLDDSLPEQWPPGTTHIALLKINIPIEKDALPSTLLQLVFGKSYNHPVDNFPTSITYLKFGEEFNQPVDNLPPTLHLVTFGNQFNQPIANMPQTLTILNLGKKFNRPVDCLPPTLKHLMLNEDFNQNVNKIPPSITHLKFGYSFDQQISALPPKLVHLIFVSSNFNQPLPALPHTLVRLELGAVFNHPIDEIVPPNLAHLSLLGEFDQPLEKLPASLKFLQLGCQFSHSLDKLPPALTHLIFEDEIACFYDAPLNNLPRTLTHLTLFSAYDKPLNNLPPNLTHLIIKDVDEIYDDNLNITKHFNEPLTSLPSSLVWLELNNGFNNELPDLIDLENLVHLKFGDEFNQEVGELPLNLKFLKLGTKFADSDSLAYLPRSLTEFQIERYTPVGSTFTTDMPADIFRDKTHWSTLVLRVVNPADKTMLAIYMNASFEEIFDLSFNGLEYEERFLIPRMAPWLQMLLELRSFKLLSFLNTDPRIAFWTIKKFDIQDVLLKEVEYNPDDYSSN